MPKHCIILAASAGKGGSIRWEWLDRFDQEVRGGGQGVFMANIYHFTHVDNVEKIFHAGGLWCDAKLTSGGFRNSGDQEIKALRSTIRVSVAPGGVVADYVPFYYAPRSPMLYKITKGSVPGVASEPHRIVYFVAKADTAMASCSCCISDRNAAKLLARFYPPDKMDLVIDWPLMREKMWNDTPEDTERKSRRMAEFLIHDFAPLSIFEGIVVYDSKILTYIKAKIFQFRLSLQTAIKPEWYF